MAVRLVCVLDVPVDDFVVEVVVANKEVLVVVVGVLVDSSNVLVPVLVVNTLGSEVFV